ncbi:hypothetical protein NL349_29380, partial [Klebsiella pneumoniae]|nr:hypothetical protein [Klebsiella pneumoniae]
AYRDTGDETGIIRPCGTGALPVVFVQELTVLLSFCTLVFPGTGNVGHIDTGRCRRRGKKVVPEQVAPSGNAGTDEGSQP